MEFEKVPTKENASAIALETLKVGYSAGELVEKMVASSAVEMDVPMEDLKAVVKAEETAVSWAVL